MSYQENQISDLIDAGIELEKEMLDSVSVTYSRGRAKYRRNVYFVMPNSQTCRNRSRRIVAQDGDKAYYKLIGVIKKWYFPLNEYKVDGLIICSNSESNALSEYWRICEKSKVGVNFEVLSRGNKKEND
jgi:hypothetical protein